MKRQSDYSVRSILSTPSKLFKHPSKPPSTTQPSTLSTHSTLHPSFHTTTKSISSHFSEAYQCTKPYLNPYNTPSINLGEASILSKLQHTVINRAPRESFLSNRPPFFSESFHGPLADIRDCPLVTLEHKDLWKKFNSIGTEMVITKSGRLVGGVLCGCVCRGVLCVFFVCVE